MKKIPSPTIKRLSLVFLAILVLEIGIFILSQVSSFCFVESPMTGMCADPALIALVFLLTLALYLIILVGYGLNKYLKISKTILLVSFITLLIILLAWLFWTPRAQQGNPRFNSRDVAY